MDCGAIRRFRNVNTCTPESSGSRAVQNWHEGIRSRLAERMRTMKDWPHSPVHRLTEAGAYIVTSGTYHRQHFFAGPARLTLLRDKLLTLAREHGLLLQAWAVFSNHYHIVVICESGGETIRQFVKQLHWQTAVAINELDGCPGRKVWFNYWDRLITFHRSYIARLNYVHYNAQKHGVCDVAERYEWCSAGWFETEAEPSFVRTVQSFGSDQIQDPDPY